MRIGFYLENLRIKNIDLSKPEKGNPGVGGTEFNFISLVHSLKHFYPRHDYVVFANFPENLHSKIEAVQASNCVDAASQAERQNCDFMVWRPTPREDAKTLLENLDDYELNFIIWAHNTPTREILDTLHRASNVKRFIPVGHEQLRLIGSHPITTKATVIHNGFDSRPYRAINGIKDPLSVVYLGSLIPIKGFGLLAKIWFKILERVPNATLKVIGGGDLYDRDAKLGCWGIAEESFENEEIRPYLSDQNGNVHSSVKFLGVLGCEKLPLLRRASVGIVNPTGRGENCPGSAVEFLASGTAVVSAASEGLLDVVTHGYTGLLGNSEADLIENVCSLLEDPEMARKMGSNGPNEVTKKFEYHSICRKWQRVFTGEIEKKFSDALISQAGYFPYVSKQELELDRKIRKWLDKYSLPVSLKVYSLWTLINPSRVFVRFSFTGVHWLAKAGSVHIEFPKNFPSVKWLHSSLDYPKWLSRKYSVPGFVEIEQGDIVIDCGSFVGAFALSALDKGCSVHVFEPSKANFQCIERNLARRENYVINCAGLLDKTGNVKFNISTNPVENSVLRPDNDEVATVEMVKVWRIEDYCRNRGITQIDFLKVEAEGTEAEIICGIGDVRVKKIAVDCSPEKDGMSPYEEIKEFLTDKGFAVIKRGFNLYARAI